MHQVTRPPVFHNDQLNTDYQKYRASDYIRTPLAPLPNIKVEKNVPASEPRPFLNGDSVCDTKMLTRYTISKFLGKGGFARCFAVQASNIFSKDIETGLNYSVPGHGSSIALKIVPKHRLSGAPEYSKMHREINLHQLVSNRRHECIVQFFGYFEEKDHFFLKLELCHEYTLLDRINQSGKGLSDTYSRSYFRNILSAVDFLHRNGILHRDIKPGNVFIGIDGRAKLGDFGLAIYMRNATPGSVSGTPNYLAPEVLENAGHSAYSDVWALGCTLFCMTTTRPPFEMETIEETYRRIKSGFYEYPRSCNATVEARRVIKRCLSTNVRERASIAEVMSDAWLRDARTPQKEYAQTLANYNLATTQLASAGSTGAYTDYTGSSHGQVASPGVFNAQRPYPLTSACYRTKSVCDMMRNVAVHEQNAPIASPYAAQMPLNTFAVPYQTAAQIQPDPMYYYQQQRIAVPQTSYNPYRTVYDATSAQVSPVAQVVPMLQPTQQQHTDVAYQYQDYQQQTSNYDTNGFIQQQQPIYNNNYQLPNQNQQAVYTSKMRNQHRDGAAQQQLQTNAEEFYRTGITTAPPRPKSTPSSAANLERSRPQSYFDLRADATTFSVDQGMGSSCHVATTASSASPSSLVATQPQTQSQYSARGDVVRSGSAGTFPLPKLSTQSNGVATSNGALSNRKSAMCGTRDSGLGGSDTDMSCMTELDSALNKILSDVQSATRGELKILTFEPPSLFVTRWVDYSNRIGFAAELSGDVVTVKLNDGTCITCSSNSDKVTYSHSPFSMSSTITKAAAESNYTLAPAMAGFDEVVKYMRQRLYPHHPHDVPFTRPLNPTIRIVHSALKDGCNTVMIFSDATIQVNLHKRERVILWRVPFTELGIQKPQGTEHCYATAVAVIPGMSEEGSSRPTLSYLLLPAGVSTNMIPRRPCFSKEQDGFLMARRTVLDALDRIDANVFTPRRAQHITEC